MSGKSPSALHVAVISGAIAVLASAMTPVYAAPPAKKLSTSKHWRKPLEGKARGKTTGGGSGMVSLEWTITGMLRP